MLAWWNELSNLQQIFGVVAIPATLILIIQLVLMLIGFADQDGDMDASDHDFHVHDLNSGDHDDHGCHVEHGDSHAIKLFTLRSIIAFLAVGGWTGLVLDGLKLPVPATIAIALLAGGCALYGIAWLVNLAFRMQASGNVNYENAVGLIGEVYLRIPALNKGIGKVNIILQERLCEIEASTPFERDIMTGESVVVICASSDGVVVMPHTRDNIEE